MNKNLLIISSTSRNNLTLAKNLQSICENLNMDNELINLEELDVPLYTPIEEEKGTPSEIKSIMKKFIDAPGFIICAPEYNGSIPPILTNIIAWISVMDGDNWRFVFNNKELDDDELELREDPDTPDLAATATGEASASSLSASLALPLLPLLD